MKIIWQLLKEFWLPLILGAAWTFFNLIDNPIDKWTAKGTINIFGPTFFFMSWLVAQWYRVKKQQKVEDGLGNIQSDIRALHLPFLPCVIFYTLRHKCQDAGVEYAFSGKDGYKKYDDNSLLKPIGLFSLGSEYNPIEQKVVHSRCSIKDQEEIRQLEKSAEASTIWIPTDVSVKIINKKIPGASLLIKKGNGSTSKIFNLELFDDVVYQDVSLKNLHITNPTERIWSISDLQDATIEIIFEFGYFHLPGMPQITEDYWPRLHNFQLILGEKSQNLLAFNLENLSKQVVSKNPEPLMSGAFTSFFIKFDFNLDKKFYDTQIFAVK